MEPNDKMIYLLVSFLVPVSMPSQKVKSMGKTYAISLFLFYVECGSILLFALLMKHFYHFDSFRTFFSDFHRTMGIGLVQTFDGLIFIMFLCSIAATMVSALCFTLYSRCCHPSTNLFSSMKVPKEKQKANNTQIEPVAISERGTQTDNTLELILTGKLGKEVFDDGKDDINEDIFWELPKGYRTETDYVVKKETFRKIHIGCKGVGEFHHLDCQNKM
jgi:hypothetical protein